MNDNQINDLMEGEVLNNIDTAQLIIEQKEIGSQTPIEPVSLPIQGPPNGFYEEKRSNDNTENTEERGPDKSSQNSQQNIPSIPHVTSPLITEIKGARVAAETQINNKIDKNKINNFDKSR